MPAVEKDLQADFLPRTFQERGVAVPFTTPLLVQARARVDRSQRIEFLLPYPSGGRRRYVMAWNAVTAMAPVKVHDRQFSRGLTSGTVQSPNAIRELALTLASDGLAGPDVAEQAERALDHDRRSRELNHFLLVARLLKFSGLSTTDLMKDGFDPLTTESRARDALARVIAEMRLNTPSIPRRLETLAAVIEPLGLPEAPERGRLWCLARELGEFADQARQWGANSPITTGHLGAYSGDVAELTAALTEAAMKAVDKEIESLISLLQNWEERYQGLVRLISRITWLLDGWEYIIALWNQTAAASDDERCMTMAEIFRLLPLVPRCEANGTSTVNYGELQRIQRHWEQGHDDWYKTKLDYEQVRKIETIRARMR